MEEEKDTMPPFWMQDGSANGRRLSRTNSLFFNSCALLIFLLVTALAFIFILAPTLHSFTSQVFKPNSVKRTWDSLNLVLVLFALLCGFLSRNNTNEETPRSYSYQEQNFSVSDKTQDYTKPNPETETQRSWYEYEYSDRYGYKPFNRLRSINSYPDLRQEPLWVNSDEQWRFYDDMHVNGYQDKRQRPVTGEEELGMKTIEVDTSEVSKKEVSSGLKQLPAVERPPPSPVEPPPPPPRGKDVGRKGKGTYQAVGKAKNHDLGAKRSQPPPPSTPPPPPPPPPIPTEKTVKEKNRSKSATKEFLASLKGKKKKQRHRSLENFESILNYSKPYTLTSQPPPPPPPPPPVFGSLFSSKKRKHKKPDISSSNTESVNGATTLKPDLKESFYILKENVSAANESPLNIPIPPPPPPFNMPVWKFKVKGDFVRIDSNSSTGSDLAYLEEVVESPKGSSEVNQCNRNDGGEPEIPLFYPSPDVNTKANTFIEKFRAGLRMEKMNSTKSNLGPSVNTGTREDAGPSSRYKADYVL